MLKPGEFAVLNPAGRDKFRAYPDGAGTPADPGHPPINYHAYAACLHSPFCRSITEIPADAKAVLVLLRKRNLRPALRTVTELRKRGVKVWISLKESGRHQVAEFLHDVTRIELFRELCAEADAYLSSTPELVKLATAFGAKHAEFIPTPYPVDSDVWDFTHAAGSEKRGIFVGTREFSVPSRRHAEAIIMADQLSRELGCPLAVVNFDGRAGGMLLKSIGRGNPFSFILEGPLEYKMLLKAISAHRVVFQLDQSAVPGQVAGDALLCRVPCVGGNSAIESVLHEIPESDEAAIHRARRLLTEVDFWKETVENDLATARAQLSFKAVADRLAKLASV